MNEQIEENGLVEEKKEFKPSWQKALSWFSIFLSLMIPIASIGLSIVCISQASEDEKNEVSIICGIALVIAITLCINDFVLGRLLLY